MKISGLGLEEFQEIVVKVSDEVYGGNVIVAPDAHDAGPGQCVARIKVEDSSGTGSRRNPSGRRMAAACWHAYRDVIHAIVESYPDAKIKTTMETYEGMAGFLRNYPSTADQNIGSAQRPAFAPDMCECGNTIAWPSWLP